MNMHTRSDIRFLHLPKFSLTISRDFRITENNPTWKDQTYTYNLYVNKFSRKEINNDKHIFCDNSIQFTFKDKKIISLKNCLTY